MPAPQFRGCFVPPSDAVGGNLYGLIYGACCRAHPANFRFSLFKFANTSSRWSRCGWTHNSSSHPVASPVLQMGGDVDGLGLRYSQGMINNHRMTSKWLWSRAGLLVHRGGKHHRLASALCCQTEIKLHRSRLNFLTAPKVCTGNDHPQQPQTNFWRSCATSASRLALRSIHYL
jgi:hypothetical protein